MKDIQRNSSIRWNFAKKYSVPREKWIETPYYNLCFEILKIQHPYVVNDNFPKSEEELHEDLVHIHYDQAFNLLRYSSSGEESEKEKEK